MNKFWLLGLLSISLLSCNKIEEKINETIDKTAENVKQKAADEVKKVMDSTISNSINSLTNAEDVVFTDVFPNAEANSVTEFRGKKVEIFNKNSVYIFKYKSDKNQLLATLEAQPTTDENRSDKTARKIDGQSIIEKITVLEKLLPENTIDTQFLDEIKSDKNIEFYRLKRIPNNSTIIFNPKNNQVFHFIEIVK